MLTHQDVTRFFHDTDEAARLVLLAGTTKGGDMFVLIWGAAVPIGRFTRQMIESVGARRQPRDSRLNRGLMPGEKLHEELRAPTASLS
jgi:FlaA1/EpsC-like NDP-sugar epimerase